MSFKDITDESELLHLLDGAKRTCRIIRAILYCSLAIFSLLWLAAIASEVLAFREIDISKSVSLLYAVVYGLGVIAMIWQLVGLFSNVIKEDSVFSEEQYLHLRAVAALALALFVFELAFTAGFEYAAMPELGFGMVANDGIAEPTINLNIGMLAFSAIMYSLSAIFRYAALLQQLSDETV